MAKFPSLIARPYEELCAKYGVPLDTLWRVHKPDDMKKPHVMHNHIVRVDHAVHSLHGFVAIVSVFPGLDCGAGDRRDGDGVYVDRNAMMCHPKRLTPLKQEVTTT